MAEKQGIDLIWFGVILAMNLQTSFLTPPFGFALFYLRSVEAKSDYIDRITKKLIPAVTTGQIYKGSIAFIVLQLIMVAAVVTYPQLVTGGLSKGTKMNADDALQELRDAGRGALDARQGDSAASGASAPAAYDPMQDLVDSMKRNEKK